MGIDIRFHIEVHKGEKWCPLIWRTPMALNSFICQEDEGKEWNENTCCYECRYYHFNDFLDECATRGIPDNASMELKEHLSGYEMGCGYFLLSELSHYYHTEEKKMLSDMLQSRDFQMLMQLDRIEKYLKQKPNGKNAPEIHAPCEERDIREIYSDFHEVFGNMRNLLMAARGLLDCANIYVNETKVRILYGVC